jgi:hypothetical protein
MIFKKVFVTKMLLREGAAELRGAPTPGSAEKTADIDESKQIFVCAACGRKITSKSSKTAVAGKHEHVEANPEGIVFHIGCFSAAPGCMAIGESSSVWTWFPGYLWQVAVCAACGAHLGWRFHSGGNDFFGLILTNLAEREE